MKTYRLPGYELGELIGRGAMGEVYRATQLSLDREVAIKILPPHLHTNPDFRDRFLTEARIAAHLQHPNIVSVYDFGETEGVIYIAMALVEGKSLDKLIAEGALAFEDIERILRQLANALDYAHKQGFIHRDVKPSNVVITPDSRVLLMDFGIAKAIKGGAQLTTLGFVAGTPKYSAPEVLSGQGADGRADLYSMGVVAFEMIAGRPPFDGTDPMQVALCHVKDPVPDLSSLRRDVPLALKRSVDRLLAKQAKDRYATAGDFVTAAFAPQQGTVWQAPGTESKTRRKGGLLSGLFSLFGRQSEPASSAGRPALPPSVAPPASSPPSTTPKDSSPVDQTFPPGTIIAPIPAPDLLDTAFGSEGADEAPDRTMIVSVRPQQEGGGIPVPVALTFIDAPDQNEVGRRVQLSQFPFVIGRDEDSDFVLSSPDRSISRRHLEIRFQGGSFWVSDNSTNGTFVNGKLLRRAVANLSIGDVLKLSKRTVLRFVADVSRLNNLSGLKLDNRYELTEELYSSHKATTYMARDTRLPRTLAIKVFSPSLMALSDYHDAYEREADIAARLNHPNIRKVVDRGEAEHTLEGRLYRLPYLCMDLMKGGNLSDRLADETAEPDLALVTDWIRMLGDALSYAHAASVVHGGLKPNAILFDEQDRPYLADFAQARTGEGSHGAVALGSPAYMAPEQWEGLGASEATDQYAFACLCYLMLTGSTPYEGQADPEVRARNFARGPVPAHEQAQRLAIPTAASAVLTKAMSIESKERYPSVQAFSAELTQAIETGRRRDDRARVFLSYRRDASAGWAVLFARELRHKHAIEAFVDTERRDRAVQFPEKLKKAIADCDIFVCMLAGDTLDSEWVREEIRIAFEHGRPMIPVFQESYRDAAQHHETAIDSLLRYDGVHLLDRRNIHVDHTISDLAQIIHRTFGQ